MTCHRDEELNLFVDGELPPSQAQVFRTHFEECSDCRLRMHEIQQQESLVREVLADAFAGLRTREKVMLKIRAERIKPELIAPERSLFRINTLKWALSGALLLVIGFLLGRFLQVPPRQEALQQMQTGFGIYCAGPGAQINGYPLAAGDRVFLPSLTFAEIQGPLAIMSFAFPSNQFIWRGRALFALASDSLLWQGGSGELEVIPGARLQVRTPDQVFLLDAGKLLLAGTGQSPLQVMVRHGKVLMQSEAGLAELPAQKFLRVSRGKWSLEGSVPDTEPSAIVPVVSPPGSEVIPSVILPEKVPGPATATVSDAQAGYGSGDPEAGPEVAPDEVVMPNAGENAPEVTPDPFGGQVLTPSLPGESNP